MDSSNTAPNKAIVGIVVVALIAIVVTTVVIVTATDNKNMNAGASQVAQTTQASGDTSSSTGNSAAVTSSTTFKDGTYTATGSYQTPGGVESIGVSVTLSGNTITDATVTQNANSSEAQEYQSDFVSGYKSLVVGKKITDVSLTRVSGSSLTPIGFTSALEDIENQAKA